MALRMAAATLRDVARSACPSGQEHAEDGGSAESQAPDPRVTPLRCQSACGEESSQGTRGTDPEMHPILFPVGFGDSRTIVVRIVCFNKTVKIRD